MNGRGLESTVHSILLARYTAWGQSKLLSTLCIKVGVGIDHSCVLLQDELTYL